MPITICASSPGDSLDSAYRKEEEERERETESERKERRKEDKGMTSLDFFKKIFFK